MKNSKFRTMAGLILGAAMAFSMVACAPAEPASPESQGTEAASTTSAAEGTLAVAKTEYTFNKLGQSEAIEATVGGAAATDVTFVSADEAVAVVTGNAIIAMGNGTTTVTATHGSEEVVIMVNVQSEAAVKIDGEDVIQLNTADNATATVTATVAVPSVFDNAEAGVTWSSSNPEVATVDENGVVTAVASGVAQIVAKSNYQITSTTTQNMMGKTVTSTEQTVAEDAVTVMVNNEFDPAAHADILGVYEGHYDWQGFADKASEENPIYTADNFKWIRAKVTLELKEDGTFEQKVVNAQRADYPAEIDQALPEGTFEEQVAKYGKTGCYVYNSFDQDPAAEEFAAENGKTFAAISGMESKGMHNFSEKGSFMIKDGQLILYFVHVNGFTGELETSEFVYGPVADGEYASNVYVPFKNLVAMNDNMSMVLQKAK